MSFGKYVFMREHDIKKQGDFLSGAKPCVKIKECNNGTCARRALSSSIRIFQMASFRGCTTILFVATASAAAANVYHCLLAQRTRDESKQAHLFFAIFHLIVPNRLTTVARALTLPLMYPPPPRRRRYLR